MFLIIDASILFSFFNPNSARRHIIESSSALGFRIISPDFAFDELTEDKHKIQKYAEIRELEFIILFSLLEKKVESFPEDTYRAFLPEANKISPHGEDTKDDPYFALALALNCIIWSDEAAFKQQSRIKVLNTKELLELLKKPKKSPESRD